MITERIKEYIDYKQFTVSSIESAIGASNGMLRKAFLKKTDIKSQWLESFLENFPDINSEWLITGKGSMIKPNKQNELYNESITKSITKTDLNQNNKKSYPLTEDPEPIIIETTGKANVVLLNAKAAASNFSQALTNPVYAKDFETLCLPTFMHRKGTFFAVAVTGDSMHPTITHKDIVAGSLKQTLDFVSGLPYVFYHEDEGLMVKRFHWNRRELGELCLTSDNEYMDDFITTIDKISTYIIKVECKISDNLRNWNSDIRQDIRELKQSLKRLERR